MSEPLRVVVVGSGGRLGAAVARTLRETPEQFRVVAYDHKSMDLLRPPLIDDHLRAIHFDALINCAAMTNIESCEDRQEEATAVNVTAPRQMAEICHAVGARMIQISTDYVYDGTKPGQRLESDPVDPLSHYAKTKLAADQAMLEVSDRFLAARTSWVFGPNRPSFVDQILHQAAEQDSVEAIGDKFSTPSFSHDIARWLANILQKPDVCGVLNLCSQGEATWCDYAQEALDIATELGWEMKARHVKPTKLEDIKQFRAPRPRFTSMNTNLLESVIGGQIRSWRDALREYLQTYYVSFSQTK